jgi:predicted membrane GTPase involved in stress response
MNVTKVRDASKTDRPLSEGSTVREDELVDVTPDPIRLRNKVLGPGLRK